MMKTVSRLGSLLAIVLLCLPAPLTGGETADAVREAGVMTVGVRGDFPPFSTATGEGNEIAFSGFDIDLSRAVADRIGVRVEFMVVEPNELIPLVAEGIVQAAPGIDHRFRWERVIDFSVSYFPGGTRALVLSSSGIRRLASLNYQSIAVPVGVDEDEILKVIPKAKIVAVDSLSAGLDLLVGRTVSALVGDTDRLLNLAAAHEGDGRLRVIEEPIAAVPVAMGLPPDDGAWRVVIDRALMELWESGTFGEIYGRWFGKDSPTPLPLTLTMEIWPD
jgi:ABC-type amino acid transport substrate-binding protein